MKNKYFTGQTCGETGTRTFWEHLVISGEILYLWGQYISIFIHLPNVNHPPNHPTTRESKDRAKFNYFLHPRLQRKNFFYKTFLTLTNKSKTSSWAPIKKCLSQNVSNFWWVKVYEGLWRWVIVCDGSWWWMAVDEGGWRLMMVYCNSW